MNDDFLEIKVDGPEGVPIPVDIFLRVLNGMTEVVSEVDKELSGKNKKTHTWRIKQLEIGSASMTMDAQSIRPRSGASLELPKVVREGLSAIQSRKNRPRGYTDKALRIIRGLVIHTKSPFNIFIANKDKSVIPTTEAVAQIDNWLTPQFESIGAVEGRLFDIASHNRLSFAIYDRDENKIICHFEDAFKQKVKDYLYGEVYVPGRVIYRGDGVPVAVYMTDIKPIVEEAEAFNVRDLMGVLNLGMPSEKYIRSLRDE